MAVGESLHSWLDAGPLGIEAWISLPERSWSGLFCPRCHSSADGSRRWYSKEIWLDPRQVICEKHGLPLLRRSGPIARLRSPPFLCAFRSHALALAPFIENWRRMSPCSPAGRLIFRPACLEDQVLATLTGFLFGVEPSIEAFYTGYWLTHLEGWPMPPAPHSQPRYQLGSMAHQPDRLALVNLVAMITRLLSGFAIDGFQAVAVNPEAYRSLQATLRSRWPDLEKNLAFAVRPHA